MEISHGELQKEYSDFGISRNISVAISIVENSPTLDVGIPETALRIS